MNIEYDKTFVWPNKEKIRITNNDLCVQSILPKKITQNNQKDYGVRVTHVSTGLFVEIFNSVTTRHQQISLAVDLLAEKLMDHHKSAVRTEIVREQQR